MPKPRPAEPLAPVTLSEHQGVRYLHLGTPWIQGAMRIAQPDFVDLIYVQRMLGALLWFEWPRAMGGQGPDQNPPQAVQLGLGAGALTRFTCNQLKWPTTVVEINRNVVEANTRHFRLPRTAQVVCGDAQDWLAQAEAGCVHALFVDLYDEQAAAPVLNTPAFYAACRRVLAPGGVMSVNLFGRSALFDESLANVQAAYGAEQVFSLRPTREGNTVVLAARSGGLPPREVLLERARWLEQRFLGLGLPARQWPKMLAATGPAPRLPSHLLSGT